MSGYREKVRGRRCCTCDGFPRQRFSDNTFGCPCGLNDFRVTKEIPGPLRFGPGLSVLPKGLPAGLALIAHRAGTGERLFYIDEFPESVFPRESIERHDAVHYYLTIPRESTQLLEKMEMDHA